MRSRRGLTLVEALIGLVLIGAALAYVVCTGWAAKRRRDQELASWRARRCRSNLYRLAKGMATYLNEFGDNRFYPFPLGRGRRADNFNGAEWLASLYWSGAVPDPGVFLCPGSGDTNANGAHLGATRAGLQFGSQTVSFAAMHYRSISSAGAAVRDDFLPNEVMASDDTQGTINHGTPTSGGMQVLFFDSHVEFKTADELDPRTAVGQKGGLLEKLRN